MKTYLAEMASLRRANLAFIAVATATLCACGGDSSPTPEGPLCNGTPRAAVVYAGTAPFPSLEGLPNACTIVATGDLAVAVDAVRRATGTTRTHVVAIGDQASKVLDLVAQRPGDFDTLSLWLVAHDASTVQTRGRVSTTYLNGGPSCEAVAAAVRVQGRPGVCTPATAFDGAEALGQLALSR